MCTAFTFYRDNFYFGRNMDIEYHFGEKVVITPRNFPINTKKAGCMENHYAMIGMANVTDNYPLYAEAANEKGLCMAGLNFPSNAKYISQEKATKTMITPYELIPFILGKCENIQQAKSLLPKIDIVDIAFSPSMPVAPLHWIVSDKDESIVIECTKDGMNIYDNYTGVITNNPPFPFHLENLKQYLNLSPKNTSNGFCNSIELSHFGQGMGAIGLPGDFSPASRFVKTFFCKENSICNNDIVSCITQVFHILDSVAMISGTVITNEGKPDTTIYSSCIDATNGDYYYKTYENNQITKISLSEDRKAGKNLLTFALNTKAEFKIN